MNERERVITRNKDKKTTAERRRMIQGLEIGRLEYRAFTVFTYGDKREIPFLCADTRFRTRLFA